MKRIAARLRRRRQMREARLLGELYEKLLNEPGMRALMETEYGPKANEAAAALYVSLHPVPDTPEELLR